MVSHDDNKLIALTRFVIFWNFFDMLYIELKLEDEI